MKKIFIVLLIIAVLLSGCSQGNYVSYKPEKPKTYTEKHLRAIEIAKTVSITERYSIETGELLEPDGIELFVYLPAIIRYDRYTGEKTVQEEEFLLRYKFKNSDYFETLYCTVPADNADNKVITYYGFSGNFTYIGGSHSSHIMTITKLESYLEKGYEFYWD